MFNEKTRIELGLEDDVPTPPEAKPEPEPVSVPQGWSLPQQPKKSKAWLWLMIPCFVLTAISTILLITQKEDEPLLAKADTSPVVVAQAKESKPVVVQPVKEPIKETIKEPVKEIKPVVKEEPVVQPKTPPLMDEKKLKRGNIEELDEKRLKRGGVEELDEKPNKRGGVEEPNENPPKIQIYDDLATAKKAGKEANKPVLIWGGKILDGPLGETARKVLDIVGDRAIHVMVDTDTSYGPHVRLLAKYEETWYLRRENLNDKSADKIIAALPKKYLTNAVLPRDDMGRIPNTVRYEKGMELKGGEFLTFDWSDHLVVQAYHNGGSPPEHFKVHINGSSLGGTFSFAEPKANPKLYAMFEEAREKEIKRREGQPWSYKGAGEVFQIQSEIEVCELENGMILVRCGPGCCSEWKCIKKSDSLAE